MDHFIPRVLWAIYWRVAIRVGERSEDFPDFAWTNTRPRMEKIGNWITDLGAS